MYIFSYLELETTMIQQFNLDHNEKCINIFIYSIRINRYKNQNQKVNIVIFGFSMIIFTEKLNKIVFSSTTILITSKNF